MNSCGWCGRNARRTGLAIGLLMLLGGAAYAQNLRRLPNTTLQLPETIFGSDYTLEPAFGGILFESPLGIVAPPGETNRLFIVARPGRIVVITNLAVNEVSLFLDIADRVSMEGEGGLLGLAFHPGYQTNRQFFVYYTLYDTVGTNVALFDRLSRFEVSADDPNRALPDSEFVMINQLDPSDDHNAGDLQFGPDGYLYVALGDGGGGYDEFRNSQRIDKDFFSGILRLDVDERSGNPPPNPHPAIRGGYRVPLDNPFVNATNFNGAPVDPTALRTEFWAVGLRNPWRISFDRLTGDLYAADVGQNDREEVNRIVKGGNYGWSYWEGSMAVISHDPPPPGVRFVQPLFEYPRVGTSGDPDREGNCVIGGLVYRGDRLPELNGKYIFADIFSGSVWALDPAGAVSNEVTRIAVTTAPAEFGTDPSNGDILVADIDNWMILRLVRHTNGTVPAPPPPTLADVGAFSDLSNLAPHPGIVPYDINVPFWSDHALKMRWFSVPDTNLFIGFKPVDNWSFPTETVWIKHFELELTNGVVESRRRLETRFLVRTQPGVYGLSYRWDESQTNASLVAESGFDESFVIQGPGTLIRTQVWHYPGRGECLICHTRRGGWALGFGSAQLNRHFNYDGGEVHQIAELANAGYFDVTVPSPETLPLLADATNTASSVEHRVRSYLAANCAQCHQPGGSAPGLWDARLSTPLAQAGLVSGHLLNNFGDQQNRVIRAGSVERSAILQRLINWGRTHMPPLATSEINWQAVELLSYWVTNVMVAQYTATIQSLRFEPSGALQLAFIGQADQTYQVEASSDLIYWQVVGAVVTDPQGQATYNESLANSPVRFFRIQF